MDADELDLIHYRMAKARETLDQGVYKPRSTVAILSNFSITSG